MKQTKCTIMKLIILLVASTQRPESALCRHPLLLLPTACDSEIFQFLLGVADFDAFLQLTNPSTFHILLLIQADKVHRFH